MENKTIKETAQEYQHESIKLSKMSKGYNWEIKVLDLDIERLEKIDKRLREKFGDKE